MGSIAYSIQDMLTGVLRRAPLFYGCHRIVHLLDAALRGAASGIETKSMRLGHSLRLDRSSFTEKTAFYTGYYDDEEIRLICGLLRPGDSAMDVGGNIGFYAVPMARRLLEIGGHLHVFEPVHSNFTRLCENIAINGLQTCTSAHEYGLSSRSGTATITLLEDFLAGSGTGNATVALPQDYANRKFSTSTVSLRRLDEFAAEVRMDRLDFLKVDIEGHEDEFLKGGAGVLSKFRPAIYLEVNKEYYRIRQLDLWDTCEETLGKSHVALLPVWKRRTGLLDRHVTGFRRLKSLSPCAEMDNIFLVPPERMNEFAAIARIDG